MKLSVCMIVKDEEETLGRCLSSVKDIGGELIVVDTGSTDNTIATAESFGAKVIRHSWEGDFARARNAGLDEAQGQWILIIDADEELVTEDTPYLERILNDSHFEIHTFLVVDSRNLEMNPQPRLWKNRPKYRFRGRIHEQISLENMTDTDNLGAHTPVRILHYGYEARTQKAKNKRGRNEQLLQQELDANPEDVRALFHLGLHYDWQPEREKAVDYYQRALRFDKDGFLPVIALRLSVALEKLGRYKEAATVSRKAIKERFPDYTDLHFTLGRIYLKDDRLEEAQKAFERCLEIGNSFKYPSVLGTGGELALLMYGHTLSRLKREDQANTALSLALDKIRRSSNSLLYLGKLYLQQLPPEEARRKLTQIADLSQPGVRKTFSMLFGDQAPH